MSNFISCINTMLSPLSKPKGKGDKGDDKGDGTQQDTDTNQDGQDGGDQKGDQIKVMVKMVIVSMKLLPTLPTILIRKVVMVLVVVSVRYLNHYLIRSKTILQRVKALTC